MLLRELGSLIIRQDLQSEMPDKFSSNKIFQNMYDDRLINQNFLHEEIKSRCLLPFSQGSIVFIRQHTRTHTHTN
jgi:hypothetical protein